jgi:hypothetical protein
MVSIILRAFREIKSTQDKPVCFLRDAGMHVGAEE